MADVCGYIDLCKLVIQTAKTIYDASRQILTNFQEQKELLMEKVDFLRNRVKLLQKKLEKEGEETGDDMDGLREVLTKIQDLFTEIAEFLEKVSGYKCRKAIQFVKIFLQEYRQYQKLFTRYTIQLHRLRENLNDLILDALFLGMGHFDMQKQYQKACADLQNDFHSFRKVVTNDEENERVSVPVERVCKAGVGVQLRNVCCPCFRKKAKPPEEPHCNLEPEVQEAMQLFDDYEKLMYQELSEELIRSM